MVIFVLGSFFAIALVVLIIARDKHKFFPKSFLKWSWLSVGILGIAFSADAIWFDSPNQPPHSSFTIQNVHKSVLPAQKQTSSVGYPTRLKIPKINVDAALDYVSITAQGELGVPKGPSDAGWYDRGPKPGENGSAVIDGHFGYKDNIPAVFDNLHDLQKGDSLYVQDDKGFTMTFTVSSIQSYSQDQADTDVFRANDGKAHLNLITCEGTWNEAQKSYSNRLVVFADKVVD